MRLQYASSKLFDKAHRLGLVAWPPRSRKLASFGNALEHSKVRVMKKIFLGLLTLVLVLSTVVVIRGLSLRSKQVRVEPPAGRVAVDGDAAAERLARALRFQTISYQDPAAFDGAAFLGFHEYLDSTYPRAHESLQREVVNQYSLLYRWEGVDPTLRPAILMAHMDVVPLESGTRAGWTHDAFAGVFAGGYVWGRGAVDDKGSLLAIFEGIEILLSHGFQPQRTVYLAFRHDEEVGGRLGAEAVASLLAERGVETPVRAGRRWYHCGGSRSGYRAARRVGGDCGEGLH